MNKNYQGVLVFTYFSYHDALIQTYVLPYVRLIRKHLNINFSLVLVCLEKGRDPLIEERNELREEGIELVWFNYKGSGIKAAVLVGLGILDSW